jgi:hypothetical protein
MTESYQCPAEGCDYTNVKSGVLGHYSGKRDDAHAGGYEKAKQLLKNGATTSNSAESTPSETSSGNPVFGDADPDAATETETVEEVTLPCGHESYNPEDAPEKPFVVSCSQCGEQYKVTK